MPPQSKKPSASKARKAKPPKKTTPAPAPVETPVVETPVLTTPAAAEEINYQNEFTEVQDKLKAALTLIKELSSQVSRLEKRVTRDQKVMNKKMKGKVKRVVDPNKPPSGFAKPGKVSDELRAFLSLGKDELIARTEVTKRINAYCKEHGLQGKEDKRILKADKTLKTLLRLGKNDELTFFNLQKYMKVHFPNKDGVFPKA